MKLVGPGPTNPPDAVRKLDLDAKSVADRAYADSLLGSGALIDGGSPSSVMSGILVIDFGAVT